MKRIGLFFKRIIIVYLMFYITISSMSSSFARMYDEECGQYVADYAKNFISTYCNDKTKTKYAYVGYGGDEIHWRPGGIFGQGTFYADCGNGVHYMYLLALGVDITQMGFKSSTTTSVNNIIKGSYGKYWERITNSADIKPGDIMLKAGHAELYIGNNQNANFGNKPYSGVFRRGPGLGSRFTYCLRPKFDVTPSGQLPGTSGVGGADNTGNGQTDEEDELISLYDENGFMYSGVAKLTSYKERTEYMGSSNKWNTSSSWICFWTYSKYF